MSPDKLSRRSKALTTKSKKSVNYDVPWSRLVAIHAGRPKTFRTFQMSLDLELVLAEDSDSSEIDVEAEKTLFDPKQFEKANQPLELERYRLSNDEKLSYGKRLTELRKQVVDRAELIKSERLAKESSAKEETKEQ